MKFDHTKITFGDHVQEHVKTASGHNVTLFLRTLLNGWEVMIGAIHQVDSESRVSTWNLDGTGNRSACHNLVMTGPKRRMAGCINIYPENAVFHRDLHSAKQGATPGIVARAPVEIEFEEGEGL